MLQLSTRPPEVEEPRKPAGRSLERTRHFEALFARSFEEMRARRRTA